MPKNHRLLAYLSLTLNAIIWGAALPIVKPALSFVTPFEYLLYRYFLAAIFSLPILIWLLFKFKPHLKTLGLIFILESIAVLGSLSFLYQGLSRTSSIEATLIANTSPIFIVIGGIFFLKEKEEKHELVGLIMAITGMTILALSPLWQNQQGIGQFSLSGNLMIIAQNTLWASYVLLAKKYYKHISKLLIGILSLWVGFLGFGFITLINNPSTFSLIHHLTQLQIPSVFLACIYMGIFGSIIAVPAYIFGNNLIEASEASLFTYLQPLITIPLAVIWLHEPFTLIMIISLLITSSGVIIASRKTTKKH